jgi:hypothetical protein
MNGMTHKQAIKLIHRRQDELLKGIQLSLLEEHLRSCESCRAYSDEMKLLTANLNRAFKAHWDGGAGPSDNMTGNVLTKAKSIPAAKQTSFNFQLLSGALVLILLALAINFVISSLQNMSMAQNSRTTTSTSTTNLVVDPQICNHPQGNSVPSGLYGLDVIQNTSYTDGDFTYDFWLYCDPSLKPDDPEHFSAIAGLGIYSSWRYTGSQVDGPVRYYYAFDRDYPLGGSVSDGPLYRASAQAKSGIDISEARIQKYVESGNPVQFSIVVDSSLGQNGAVLSFDLKPAARGYHISNLHVEKVYPSYESLVAFISGQSGNTDIYTMHADGSQLTNITNNPASDYSPLWSPDGRKIAFVSDRTGNEDIFVMDPDGSNLTQLTDNPGYDGYFSWSPDGKRIVYITGKKDINQAGQLALMEADGSKKTTLTDPGSYLLLGWSPDSRKIVFIKQNPDADSAADNLVAVINTDGTGYHEWNAVVDGIKWEDDQHFIGYGWDGQNEYPGWLLRRFSTNDDPPVEIASHSSRIVEILRATHVVAGGSILAWYHSDGSPAPFTSWNSSEVCRGTGDQFIPSNWTSTAPDESKALIVIPCQSGKVLFYVNPLDGSEIRKLTDFFLDGAKGGGPTWSWSPNGKYGIMTISNPDAEQESDLYLFDVEQMLKDPSTQPIRLTEDNTTKNEVVWQPAP